MNQNTNNNKVRWIVVFTAIILILAISTAALILSISQFKSADNKAETVRETEPIFSIEPAYEDGITLTMGNAVAVTSADNTTYVTQFVSAIITPDSVTDKYVTWSVKWADNAALKNEDIANYLRIDSESQGSLSANINCYKAFRGSNAILECVSRQGNKKATCTITYDGKPSSVTVAIPSGVTKYNLGKDSVDTLYSGNTYTCKLNLDNIFHDVGTSFNDFSVTVQGIGSFQYADYVNNPRGKGFNIDYSNIPTKSLDSIKGKLISASCSGGNLVIEAKGSYMGYYDSFTVNTTYGSPYGTYKDRYYAYQTDADGNQPYFLITVSHKTLGFSAQYKCFIAETVDSLSLSKTTITF